MSNAEFSTLLEFIGQGKINISFPVARNWIHNHFVLEALANISRITA